MGMPDLASTAMSLVLVHDPAGKLPWPALHALDHDHADRIVLVVHHEMNHRFNSAGLWKTARIAFARMRRHGAADPAQLRADPRGPRPRTPLRLRARVSGSGLEKLVYYVLFPALLFRSLAAVAKIDFMRTGVAHRRRRCAVHPRGFRALRSRAKPLFKPRPASCTPSGSQCGYRFNTYIGLADCREPLRRGQGVALAALPAGRDDPARQRARGDASLRTASAASSRAGHARRWWSPGRGLSRGTCGGPAAAGVRRPDAESTRGDRRFRLDCSGRRGDAHRSAARADLPRTRGGSR